MAILVTRGARYIGGVTVDYLLSRGENTWLFGQSGGGHRQALDYGTPDGTAILPPNLRSRQEIDVRDRERPGTSEG
jgi:UDP-glucose 4-epimerase